MFLNIITCPPNAKTWDRVFILLLCKYGSGPTIPGQSLEFERRIINLQTGNYRVSQKIVLLSGFEFLTMEWRGVFRGNIFDILPDFGVRKII